MDQRRSNDLLASSSTSNSASAVASSLASARGESLVIFNSIISNLTDGHATSIDIHDADTFNRNNNAQDAPTCHSMLTQNTASGRDLAKPSYSTNSISAKNLIRKRKIIANRLENSNELNQHNENEACENAGRSDLTRMPLKNDLNATNNTFLQALNDLRLDYNDLTATHSANVSDQRERNQATQSTSNERYFFALNQYT